MTGALPCVTRACMTGGHKHAKRHSPPASTAGFQAMEGSISSTPGVGLAYTMDAPWWATCAIRHAQAGRSTLTQAREGGVLVVHISWWAELAWPASRRAGAAGNLSIIGGSAAGRKEASRVCSRPMLHRRQEGK